MRAAVDHLFREGQLLAWGVPATGVLVETLLARGTDADVAEAEAAIERLAAAPADEGLVIREIWLLRLRALLARANGDEAAYADFRDRYRDMANIAGLRRAHEVGRGDAMTAPAPSGVLTSSRHRRSYLNRRGTKHSQQFHSYLSASRRQHHSNTVG